MKSHPRIAAALVIALLMLAPTFALAQKQKKNEKPAQKSAQKTGAGERLEPDDKGTVRADVPEEVLANRRERMNEDADAEIPYYNNFLTAYRLGPEDIISVSVFGLDKYSKTGITVPPDGRIDYYFVRDGLHVAGKTTQQVADEIAQHLDEYIIDPKVTVSLDKAMSMRYGVIGDVAKPGIMIMARRLSVYEALSEAGGVLPTGDKKKVTVLHWNADRTLTTIPVNISAIEKGQAADNYFLSPGDQVFVPGNRFKTVQKVLSLLPVLSFARIFTGGF
ncbi:MAG: polysaccharide biosynthesis/export protein [Acidobacteriota bacterium]|jgi:polysaccharide export outer membrane protein|nr:polysaccharide biosynthesis/export protein [Acidobacteriota bacterium]